MSSNGFRFAPLDPNRNEIRLLTLSPGQSDEQLRCSLSTMSLATHPVYNALSYVWGDPVYTGNNLTIDGHPFSITPNLHSALRHLRQASGGYDCQVPLWVDALCINQGDMDERSQQVAMMRDIYTSAAR